VSFNIIALILLIYFQKILPTQELKLGAYTPYVSNQYKTLTKSGTQGFCEIFKCKEKKVNIFIL
jgi:hypothetical protein